MIGTSSPLGWRFLGTATGSAVTLGPIIWTGLFEQLMFTYVITGYSGSAVGRILMGSAALSATAATNGNRLREGIAAETVTSVSVPGLPLAVTVSAIARGGYGIVQGASGAFKHIDVQGHNGNPSVTVPPTLFVAASFFSDLGTNLPIQRLQMSVYDTITAVALSSQTFNTGSRITVWGRNSD